jgi:hypothetical protein
LSRNDAHSTFRHASRVERLLVRTAKSEQLSARLWKREDDEEREAAKVRNWLWSSALAAASAANPEMRLPRNALKYLKKMIVRDVRDGSHIKQNDVRHNHTLNVWRQQLVSCKWMLSFGHLVGKNGFLERTLNSLKKKNAWSGWLIS